MVQGDPRDGELLGEVLGELGLVDEAVLDEEGSEASVVSLLDAQYVFELFARNDVSVDEELTESQSHWFHRRGRVAQSGGTGEILGGWFLESTRLPTNLAVFPPSFRLSSHLLRYILHYCCVASFAPAVVLVAMSVVPFGDSVIGCGSP